MTLGQPSMMKQLARSGVWLAAAAGVAGPLAAQELKPTPGFWMRAGGGIRTGYHVHFVDSAPALPSGAGNFANGYVLPSVSGTNAVYTWNWGYANASQVQGSTLNLERFDSRPRVGDLDGGSHSTYGGELRAGFEALRFELFDREIRFGLEAGYQFGTLSATASGRATGNASYTSAVYSFAGPGGQPIQPPGAPYSGTFDGPGPLIPLSPRSLSTQTTSSAVSESSLTFDATLHTMKLGPYLEVPLGRNFLAGFSLGYCSVLPDAQLRIQETTTYAGTSVAPTTVDQTVRRSDWKPGMYAELRLQYEINRRLSVFVGGEFQMNGDIRMGAAGRSVRVEMGTIYGGTAGVRYLF